MQGTTSAKVAPRLNLVSFLCVATLSIGLGFSRADAKPAANATTRSTKAGAERAGGATEKSAKPSSKTTAAVAALSPEDAALAKFERVVWLGDSAELLRAEPLVVRLMQDRPQSVAAHYLLACLYIHLALDPEFSSDISSSYYQNAKQLAVTATLLEPSNELGFVALAEILQVTDQEKLGGVALAEAESLVARPSWRLRFIRARLTTDPKSMMNPDVMRRLVALLAESGQGRELVATYIVSLAFGNMPTDSGSDLLKWRTQTIANLSLFDQAYSSAPFKLAMGYLAHKNDDSLMAYAFYQMVLQDEPDNRVALFFLGSLCAGESKDPERALRLLGRYLDLYGKDLAPREHALATAGMGAAAVGLKHFAQGQAFFVKAASEVPDGDQHDLFLQTMVAAYRDAKARSELVRTLTAIAAREEGSPVLYAALGDEEQRARHFLKAARAYEDSLTLDPMVAATHVALAKTQLRLGLLEEALQEAENASLLRPNDPATLYDQAAVYAALGHFPAAMTSLSKAAAARPALAAQAAADPDFVLLKATEDFKALVRQSSGAGDVPAVRAKILKIHK